jgi:hypothetical protein
MLLQVLGEYHANVGDGSSEGHTVGDGLNMKEVEMIYMSHVSYK